MLTGHELTGWGEYTNGQLGHGEWSEISDQVWTFDPVTVSDPKITSVGVTAVATGYSFAIALLRNGTVWAWGIGNGGQLGNGVGEHSKHPVETLFPKR